jgi:acyl dehydratase
VQGDRVEALPTMAAVLASPTEWMRDPVLGIDWSKLVALSHHVETFHTLPTSGNVRSQVSVTEVTDRGPARGAVIHWERELTEEASGVRLAVLKAHALARNNGGFGGKPPASYTPLPAEAGPPDETFQWPTLPNQGLIYRLSGDMNPLHSDPAVALAAGFERPILHGLCTLGICGFVIMTQGPSATASLQSISGRYTGVVYPGETLSIDVWRNSQMVRFRCRVAERNVVVIEHGTARCP